MQQQIKNIKNKLNKLKSLDKGLKVFGAKEHKYIFNKCLSEEEIVKIEKKYNITLPKEYRFFLKQIENGGVGPDYGLYSLKEAIKELHGNNSLSLINKPFPLKKTWLGTKAVLKEYLKKKKEFSNVISDWIIDYGKNYQQYFYDLIDKKQYYKNYTAFDTKHLVPPEGKIDDAYLEYAYEETSMLQLDKGVLRLAHIGCGSHFLLVITGKLKGTVWLQREDYIKHINNFLDWYERWLDYTLLNIYYGNEDYTSFTKLAHTVSKKVKRYNYPTYLYLELYERLGKICFNNKKFKKSITYFQQLINTTPKGYEYFKVSAYNWIARIYIQIKKYNEALVILKNVKKKDSWSYSLCGIAYNVLGIYDKAILAYKKALVLKPNWIVPLDNMGYTYTSMGKYEKAIKIHQKVIKKDPSYSNAYYNIACNYTLQNKIQEAIPYFVKAVKLGYEKENIKKDRDIKNLKNTPIYKKLILNASKRKNSRKYIKTI